jgi:hypothetical protein
MMLERNLEAERVELEALTAGRLEPISFPVGSRAIGPIKNGDGERVIRIFPFGEVSTERMRCFDWFFWSGDDYEFSPETSWPDTRAMKEFIEGELSAGRPLTFRSETVDDAMACFTRLVHSEVSAANPFRGRGRCYGCRRLDLSERKISMTRPERISNAYTILDCHPRSSGGKMLKCSSQPAKMQKEYESALVSKRLLQKSRKG